MLTQVLLNGLVAGSGVTLLAVAYGLIYRISGFFDLTFGAVYVLAPYAVYMLEKLGIPLPLSIALGVAGAVLVGLAAHLLLYAPMMARKASPLVLLLTSLGVYTILHNSLSILAGDSLVTLRSGADVTLIDIGTAVITTYQLAIIAVGLGGAASVSQFLSRTSLGADIRAVASDSVLADLSGLNSSRVASMGLALGFALASVASILNAFDVDVTPGGGMQATMNAIVAMILGGTGGVGRAAAGGILLGLSQHFGAWQIGSQWQDGVTYLILGMFLLLLPKGLPSTGLG